MPTLGIPMSEDAYDRIGRTAKAAGLAKATWARLVLVAACNRPVGGLVSGTPEQCREQVADILQFATQPTNDASAGAGRSA